MHLPAGASVRRNARLIRPCFTVVSLSCSLDGLGGWLITGIEGGPSNAMGISLPLVRRLLTEVGVMVTDLWKRD
jgi:hypothetical protein